MQPIAAKIEAPRNLTVRINKISAPSGNGVPSSNLLSGVIGKSERNRTKGVKWRGRRKKKSNTKSRGNAVSFVGDIRICRPPPFKKS